MPIRKALATDGEHKTIQNLLCGDYELNNMSWNQLQQKYKVLHDTVYTAVKRKKKTRRIAVLPEEEVEARSSSLNI